MEKKNPNTIFSLDWPITKNQMSAEVIFCHFNTKREEAVLLKQHIWFLVTGLSATLSPYFCFDIQEPGRIGSWRPKIGLCLIK